MSIIRSNIARQLLAEGGAPRTPFSRGGRDRDVQMSGVAPSSPSTTGFEGSPEMGGRGTTETYGFDQSDDTPQDNFKTRSLQNQIDYELGLKNMRNLMNPFAKPELPPQFYYNKDMFDEDLDQYGLSGKSLERIGNLQKGLDTFKDTGKLSQSDFEKAFFGPDGRPPKNEGGDNEPIKKLRAPITEKKEKPKSEFDDILKFYGARFEDGGDVRQEYGLGSIVKKATRAVKKVVKSPIGKAALLGGLAYFGPSFLAGTKFGFSGAQGPLALQRSMKAARLGRSFGQFVGGLDPLTTILGTSLLAGGLSKEDEEDEKLPTVANTDPDMVRTLEFYGGPRRFAAEGGMMEQDEMLDLDGNEMDLRGGGFVPLGEYEKKDDVPARLSKNEFVFTADAVRAAGGGRVDKGADVMYKTMKTLENKVA